MRNDLREAVALVKSGATYGQAASKLKITRNQVAGACNRAGVKVGHDREESISATVDARNRRWAKLNAKQRTREVRPMVLASIASRQRRAA